MKRWMTAVAVLMFGASMTVAVAQQGGAHGPRGPRPSFVEGPGKELSLTDTQKTEINGIEKATRDNNATFFETVRTTMEQFRAARQADDTAKLEALKPTMDAQRTQMKQIRDDEMKKIIVVLTAEQQAKLEKIRAEHQAEHPRSN
jgi:Spy/CpxP family protein refolding chaperone